MSDIHVLTGDGLIWQLVMHIPVADVPNSIGLSYRTALVNSGLGGSTALPDGDGTAGTISAAEKTLILAGAVFEFTVSFLVESGGTTTAQINATADALYAQMAAVKQTEMTTRLRYYGHTRDVP